MGTSGSSGDTLRARDRKRAQAVRLHRADGERRIRDVDRHLARDGVGHGLCPDLVGNVHDVELQLQLQELHRELRRGAGERGGVIELAGIRPGVIDQLPDRPERHRRMHEDDVGRQADARDRREVAQLVVGHLRVERDRDRVRRDVGLEQRVPVRRRLRDVGRAQRAGGADAVFDDDLLAPQPREALGDGAPHDIRRGSGVERNDVADGFTGPGLRPRAARVNRGRSRELRRTMPAMRSPHHAPP